MDVSGNIPSQTTLIYPIITDTSYNQYTNVLLIDNTTPSYQTFADSVNPYTFPIVYSKDCSSVELLEVLRNLFTTIPRMGFVFTSNSNNSVLFLDNMPLFMNEEQEPYSNNVQLVVSMIREFSVVNMDFLACDTLNYSNWKNYYNLLTQSTGVIVGASDNKTGNLKYGGDWVLESTGQDIETIYFTHSIEYYSYLLDAVIDANFTAVLQNNPPWGIYTAEKWNSSTNTLIEYRGNGKDAITSGVSRGTSVSGNGSTGSITYLQGTSTSTITWPASSIPTNFTVCSITRYSGGSNKGRIFDGNGINWLHGHVNNAKGYAYYGSGWISQPPIVNSDDWLVMCGKNGLTKPNNILANGVGVGDVIGGSGGGTLTINNGMLKSSEPSDFQFSHVIIWDKVLTDTEMLHVSNKLMQQLSGESPIPLYNNIYYPPVPPSPTVYIDAGNTLTVASGNLQVRITDLSNTSLNGVYFYYALNNNVDASFANTFVRANVSPYTFWIPSITDISNTLYVRAQNTAGNSSPAANLQVIVYQTPRVPPSVSFTLVGSGNVKVSINELAQQPSPYYYLNKVSYYLYAYNTLDGINLSGNTSTLIYNRPIGVLSNTNSTYGNIVTYVNTGLSANTYTMYVIARNDFGNSNPVSANIAVLFTPSPPTIDQTNTKSVTSGNLNVAFTDTFNNGNNQVEYTYFMYDSTAAPLFFV